MGERPESGGNPEDRIHDLEVWVSEHDKTVKEICDHWDEWAGTMDTWATSMEEWCTKQHEAVVRLRDLVGNAAAFMEEVASIELDRPPTPPRPPFSASKQDFEQDK